MTNPSIDLNHHVLENEEINLQVDTSNSLPSTSQVETDIAILIACDALSLPEKDQKKCIMFANLADMEPVTLTANTGKKYCLLSKSKNIGNILVDQPVGNWELPLENTTTSTLSNKSKQYFEPYHQGITIPYALI